MIVIITGASRGIGHELVKKCSLNKSDLVIAVSRNPQNLQKWISQNEIHNVLALKLDITKETQRKKLVSTLIKLNIRPDTLVNNAAVMLSKPFQKITPNELLSVYNVNVFAPFSLIQALLPIMQTKTKAHIVNISSMGGFQGSSKFAGLSAYSSSKAALAGLTECLAEELKLKNIAVNCLALGAVQTEMLAKAFPGYKAPLTSKELADYIYDFAKNGQRFFNGKILPVSSSTP